MDNYQVPTSLQMTIDCHRLPKSLLSQNSFESWCSPGLVAQMVGVSSIHQKAADSISS